MRIRWIELNGFKSFPERVRIELNQGITCFVGPNGAGKSNIIDAFRWVLGEHNPRALRGERMDEVIFQGSQSRREKGLAEVTLMISLAEESENGNTVKTKEVEIKRRLLRTGESFFYINGKQSRLKDIREFFLAEGVDIKTYSIVDQYKLSEILTKSSQRRSLLEECAGISIYKVKKAESEEKLTSAKENLQRVMDILRELERQYRMLERQAKRAERYKKILDEISTLELQVAKGDCNNLLSILEEIERQIEELTSVEKSLRGETESLHHNLEKVKEEIADIERALNTTESELKHREQSKSQLEREIIILSKEETSKEELISRLSEENASLNGEIEKNLSEIKAISEEVETLKREIENQKNKALLEEESIIELNKQIGRLNQTIENQRKALFSLSTELANRRNQLQNLRKNHEATKLKLSSLKQRKEELSLSLERVEKEREAVIEKIEQLKKLKEATSKEINNKKREIEENQRHLKQARDSLIEEKKREASLSGKVDALRSEIYENQNHTDSLIEYLEVKEEVETLVELLLEDRLKARVINSPEELKNLNDRKYFFFPNYSAENDTELASLDGQNLGAFIRFKDSRLSSIFRNVYFVNQVDEAIELRIKNPSITVVTKTGVVFFSDGFIKIGKSRDLLKKKRMLDQTVQALEESKLRIESLETIIGDRERINDNLRTELDTEKAKLASLEIEFIKTQESLNNLNKGIEGLKQRINFTENEERALLHEIEEQKKSLQKLNTEVQELNDAVSETENQIETLKSEQTILIERSNKIKEEISEIRIKVSTLNERLNNRVFELTRLKEVNQKTSKKIEENQNQILTLRQKISQIRAERDKKIKDSEFISGELLTLTEQVKALKESLAQKREDFEKLNLRINQISSQLGDVTLNLAQKRALERETRSKLESIWSEIYNLYGKDILKEEIEVPPDLEAMRVRLKQLKAQLKEIGAVDMEILKEYSQVKERYDFLLHQQKDIETSIEELETAIRKISSITKRRLRETFDDLREKFNSLFQELFDGGKADLVLSDQNDILDSEIDIIAQPPGKKLGNINLLSGGERTLTAVAYLFACLSIRPSPLCILDEVDAPLDDQNTVRLRGLIRRLSENTQFLIITHNKLIMEAADYIYGVTMQEEGVSSILSLELKEAEAYA